MDLEDSLHSGLEYESEVAYIALTSPVPRSPTQDSPVSGDEFDFSIRQSPPARLPPEEEDKKGKEVREEGRGEDVRKPPLMSKQASARPQDRADQQRSPTLVSPLSLSVPHYTLDSDLPTTPTSKLRRIKQAQASPTLKQRPKLDQPQHLYSTLVVYGASGCGRTHLVEKLVLSNPSLFAKVIPSTTRRRRANEVSGVDFHYLSHREMALAVDKGEFIESISVHKRAGTKGKKAGSELRRKAISQASPPYHHLKGEVETPPPTPPSTPPTSSREGGKYGSLFDLSAEDSPSVGGEIFGTSYEALTAAVQQGKPCILLNVSTRGAQQLKTSGLDASYVLVHRDHTPKPSHGTPKARHASRVERSKDNGHTPLEPDQVISSASLDQAYADLHHYALQLVGALKLPSTSSYQAAQYEWEALPTVQFEHSQSLAHQKLAEVTFSELLAYFHSANLKSQIQRAKAEHSHSLFSLSRLGKKLRSERLLVQAITYCQINEKERLHLRMLQTLYSKLTGNSLTCRRFGAHWQEIGFTGVDPADDLHDVGLLGVTQLIYFLENVRTARFCKQIFQYCHQDTHVIPFVTMSFGFSQLSLEALGNGSLNKLCNKRDQVFVIVNEFYMAAFYHYYQVWKSSRKSILQLGLLMQECGDYCKNNPTQVMHEFDKQLSIREPQNQLLSAILPKVENAFTPFDKMTTT